MTARGEQSRVVCLTPVRNEAWILRHFLAAASLWADDILLADQGSTDGSLEIAQKFPRVIMVPNSSPSYDENHRQRLLIAAARRLTGPRILVALDADEFLSPALAERGVIPSLMAEGCGAVIRVPWVNLRPGLVDGWVGHRDFVAAWFDDGRLHESGRIHAQRVPVSENDRTVEAGPSAMVLHWQYTAMSRMRSKHRWYQAWERLHRPNYDPIRLYRQYHHMDAVPGSALISIPESWLAWYRRHGVALETIKDDGWRWWDSAVLAWMEQQGPRFFARDAIWDFDWREAARRIGMAGADQFADPRNMWQRVVHLWLKRTQPFHTAISVRAVDKIVRHFF